MKHIGNFFLVASSLLFSLFQVACNDSEYGAATDHFFIEETGVKSNQRKVFIMEEEAINLLFTPRLSNVLNEDVKIAVEVDPQFLEAFNEKNGTSYEPLPASFILL